MKADFRGLFFFGSLALFVYGIPSQIYNLETWLTWYSALKDDFPWQNTLALLIGGVGIFYFGFSIYRNWKSKNRTNNEAPESHSSTPSQPQANHAEATPPEAVPADPAPCEDRVYTHSTIEEIYNSVKDLTVILANRVVEPHIGKWFRINASIVNVIDTRDTIMVYSNLSTFRHVFLYFSKEKWSEHLETLGRSHCLFVEGKITKIDPNDMILEECEIIEVTRREEDS